MNILNDIQFLVSEINNNPGLSKQQISDYLSGLVGVYSLKLGVFTDDKEFVDIKFPGYKWSVKEEALYSFKRKGMPLKLKPRLVDVDHPYYAVSHLGLERKVYIKDLLQLKSVL